MYLECKPAWHVTTLNILA